MAGKTRKDQRLDLRISRENKELIEQAARVTEKTMTAFIMEKALQAARYEIASRLQLNGLRARANGADESHLVFIERSNGKLVFKARRNLDVETVLTHGRQSSKSLYEIADFYGLSNEAVEEAAIFVEKLSRE